MSAQLSPQEAAEIVGVSRFAIMRAIKADKLRAIRDNSHHWKIDREALELWEKNRRKTRPHTERTPKQNTEHNASHSDQPSPSTVVEVAVLQERLAAKERALLDQQEAHAREVLVLRERITSAEDQLAKVEARHEDRLAEARLERAGWQEQAQKLTAQLSERKRRWWQRR